MSKWKPCMVVRLSVLSPPTRSSHERATRTPPPPTDVLIPHGDTPLTTSGGPHPPDTVQRYLGNNGSRLTSTAFVRDVVQLAGIAPRSSHDPGWRKWWGLRGDTQGHCDAIDSRVQPIPATVHYIHQVHVPTYTKKREGFGFRLPDCKAARQHG